MWAARKYFSAAGMREEIGTADQVREPTAATRVAHESARRLSLTPRSCKGRTRTLVEAGLNCHE
jgi:hypothetical protein